MWVYDIHCDKYVHLTLVNCVDSFFSGAINGLSISSDGELACTVGDDKTAKMFDIINFGESPPNHSRFQVGRGLPESKPPPQHFVPCRFLSAYN